MSESDHENRSEVTRILLELGSDVLHDEAVRDRLLDLIYDQLHQIASRLMGKERAGHTLQPTALVNEAYLRLVDQTRATYNSRVHFLSLAARTMRRILVDHARRTRASKRGGEWRRIPLDEDVPLEEESALDVLSLDRVLDRFAAEDPRAAQVVELRVFGGLKIGEIATALGVSKRTVDQDWAMGSMWLSRELHEP
jgi:RNA polymerase sigma factor (TIGR02999 family)